VGLRHRAASWLLRISTCTAPSSDSIETHLAIPPLPLHSVHRNYIYIYIRVIICYKDVYTHIYVYTCTHIYTYTHMRVFVCVYVCVFTYTLTPTRTRSQNYTQMDTHTHTSTRMNVLHKYTRLHWRVNNSLKKKTHRVNFVCNNIIVLPHTATHCAALQHSATNCDTLQQTAPHCNKPQHIATNCSTHITCTYRVAKTHRIPYLYSSFSAKEPYI